MSPRVKSSIAIAAASIAILASLAIVLPIAAQLVHPVGPTSHRMLRGAEDERPMTCGEDLRMPMIVVNDVVWTPCPADPTRSWPGGVARLDPEAGVLDLSATLPNGAPEWLETLGVLPSDDGSRIAFAYRVAVPEDRSTVRTMGGIAVAIADDDGLWRAPVEIHAAPESHLLGMAWVGEALEIAITARATQQSADILRVRHEGELQHAPSVSPCGILEACMVRGAYHVDDGWHFVVSGTMEDVRTWIWSTGSDGTRTEIGDPSAERAFVDLGIAGMLLESTIDHVGFTVDREGRWAEQRAPSPIAGRRILLGHYEWAEGRTRPRLRHVDPSGRYIAHVVGGHTLAVSLEPGPPAWINVDGQGVVMPAFGDGATLRDATFLPRRAGGHWLVAPSGAAIAIAASGERADPLGAFEHVYRVSPRAYTQLWYLLLGLPILLVLGVAAAAMLRRRTVFGLAIGATTGAVLFLVIAFVWALDGVHDALP